MRVRDTLEGLTSCAAGVAWLSLPRGGRELTMNRRAQSPTPRRSLPSVSRIAAVIAMAWEKPWAVKKSGAASKRLKCSFTNQSLMSFLGDSK